MSVIEVDEMTKRYDGKTVVDGVSFSVEEGEIFAIQGLGHRVSGTVRIALGVGDTEQAAARLIAAGAAEVAPPVLTPRGDRSCRVEAPDGMQLTLFSPHRLPRSVRDSRKGVSS